MSRLHSILLALALGTVPCVGAFAVWALWPVHGAVISASSRLNGALEGLNGVEKSASTATVKLSADAHASLGKIDAQVATIGPGVKDVVKKAGPVLDGLDADTVKLGNSIDLVNAPCVPGPCGTVADVGKTLNTVRGTFGQIEIAANHENRNLSTLDTQEATLFEDFHGTATRANTSLDTFNFLLANPNVALMIDNGGEFTTTAVAVEKKLAQCTLHPTLPCVLKSDILFGAQVGGYLLR